MKDDVFSRRRCLPRAAVVAAVVAADALSLSAALTEQPRVQTAMAADWPVRLGSVQGKVDERENNLYLKSFRCISLESGKKQTPNHFIWPVQQIKPRGPPDLFYFDESS